MKRKRHLISIVVLLLFCIAAQAQRTRSEIFLPEADTLLFSNYLKNIDKSSYMRIVIDKQILKDNVYYLNLPCKLDGYYFGADAKRGSKVTSFGSLDDQMDDDEDFPANQTYWVKSDIDLDQIVIMSPGVSTLLSNDTELDPTDPGSALVSELGYFCLSDEEIQQAINKITVVEVGDSQKDNRTYDLTGREVNAGYRGIVIRNGKKFVQQ